MKHQTKLTRTLAAVAFGVLGHIAPAQALTITFDDLSGNLANTTTTYGVTFQHSSLNQYLMPGTGFISGYVSGKVLSYFALTDAFETLALPAASNSVFTLSSLDLLGANFFAAGESGKVTFEGFNSSGVKVASKILSVAAGNVSTYGAGTFLGFSGLSSLKLKAFYDSSTGLNNRPVYVGVDNINITITPVPEPETIAMLLVGLGVVGATARRRKRA